MRFEGSRSLGEVYSLMRAAALFPRQCCAGDQQRKRVYIAEFGLGSCQHGRLTALDCV